MDFVALGPNLFWYVFHILLGIKYGFMKSANQLILFLIFILHTLAH